MKNKIKAVVCALGLTLLLSSCVGVGGETPKTSDATFNNETPSALVITETPNSETPTNIASPTPALEEVKYNEYDIDLEYSPDTRIATGMQTVSYKNKTGMGLRRIYFNVYSNAFTKLEAEKSFFSDFAKKIYANGYDYGYMRILNASADKEECEYELNGTVLSVTLNNELKPDEEITLQLYFEAYVPKINHRTGANDSAAWFGNFFPILAVYDQFGWHTAPYYPAGDPFYSNIANYNVSITTPPGYVVVGTGEREIIQDADMQVTLFSAKMVRDFAFAISNKYKYESIKTDDNITVNLYYYSDLENAGAIVQTAKTALKYYGSKLAAYPYRNFNIIEMGMFLTGGMEYPQIVFMDTQQLLSGKYSDSLVHEIGHQWFYNIIGSNQVKEAWLDEGVTMYVQLGALYTKEQIDTKMQRDYLDLNSGLSGYENKTLLQDISVYKSWDEYYAINYTRGKLMLYSLNQKLGDEKFNEFLKLYYGKYSFKTVTKDDFIATAEEVYGASLADFFDAWLGGYTLPPLTD